MDNFFTFYIFLEYADSLPEYAHESNETELLFVNNFLSGHLVASIFQQAKRQLDKSYVNQKEIKTIIIFW